MVLPDLGPADKMKTGLFFGMGIRLRRDADSLAEGQMRIVKHAAGEDEKTRA
jgi:hypothetical protein